MFGRVGPSPLDRVSQQIDDSGVRHQIVNPPHRFRRQASVAGADLSDQPPFRSWKQRPVPVIAAGKQAIPRGPSNPIEVPGPWQCGKLAQKVSTSIHQVICVPEKPLAQARGRMQKVVHLRDGWHPDLGMRPQIVAQPGRSGLLRTNAKEVRAHGGLSRTRQQDSAASSDLPPKGTASSRRLPGRPASMDRRRLTPGRRGVIDYMESPTYAKKSMGRSGEMALAHRRKIRRISRGN